ncbi:MAG: acetyl-CoA carboxylase biotin carboxyl carrier protein [Bacteroidota bacterium]
MTFKEIQELIKLINKSNLTEFKMSDGEFNLTIRTKKYSRAKSSQQIVSAPQQIVPIQAPMPQMPVQPVAPAPAATGVPTPSESMPAVSPQAEEANDQQYLEVRSPMVGTFYRSSAPDKPPFKKVGDSISAGEVVCIVEAMKLFNEIEAEVTGKIVKVMIDDASPVEYDQVLFLVDPKA